MRKALYIVLLCIVSAATSFAQTTIFNSQQFLTENKAYFFNIETEDKTLMLYAKPEGYDVLEEDEKEEKEERDKEMQESKQVCEHIRNLYHINNYDMNILKENISCWN